MKLKEFNLYKLLQKSIFFITLKTIIWIILFVMSAKMIDLTKMLFLVVLLYILLMYLKKIKAFKKIREQIYNFSDEEKENIDYEVKNAEYFFENEYIVTDSYLINLFEFKIIKYLDIKKIYKSFTIFKDEPRYVVNVVIDEGIFKFTTKSFYNKDFCINLDKLILEKNSKI